jgi:hypothetical protein
MILLESLGTHEKYTCNQSQMLDAAASEGSYASLKDPCARNVLIRNIAFQFGRTHLHFCRGLEIYSRVAAHT